MWSATLGFTYNKQLGDLPLEMIMGADALYESSIFVADDLDPVALEPANIKYNARIGVQAIDASWQLLVSGLNLSNERIGVRTIDILVQPGSYATAFAEPKTVSIDFRYRF
jgi:hypothetical protein